ncbi:aconitase X swivel domain-containing protein [Methylovirgula sp. 4M-Z18]|uniref:aconitase X swivel domain-containing protein n=1 Tax=Methylovirgula sp. 4M-Z18 TaxID=2293567 RepID=UPI000E2FA7A6|nr:DUF126 domain-containing protein [Methylovirgula sp. 4M-Z18]RFB80171.1 DUF126 domain-containing protein [Methylovirgula sp. 4M-Z18]
MTPLQADVLLPGADVVAEPLILRGPISFWGGVDPKTGTIIDVRHPDRDQVIHNRILCLPGTIGSSSAAAVMLELIHAERAPAALILNAPDAILLLGIVVAREMGYRTPGAYRLSRSHFSHLARERLAISGDGRIAAG